MPPVNQGSRTAMVTWTVVTSFLFVVATVFAIYEYVEASRLADTNATMSKKYNSIVADSALNSPEVAALSEVQKNPANNYDQSAGLLFVSEQRADRLGKLIAGPTAESPEAATSAANRALASMTGKLKSVGIDVAAKDLIAALNLVTDQAVARATEAANSNKARDEAVASLEQAKKDAAGQIGVLTNQLTELRTQLDQASANVQTMTQTKDAELQQTAGNVNAKLAETQQNLDKANVQIAQLKGQLDDKDKELKKVQGKLAEIRPDVNKPVTRQADGHIVRVATGGVCYIDLGAGDQVIPGMTFEVYDRNEGIPAVPADPINDTAMPKGKGSIEVVRVGGTSSECRIVNQVPNQAFTEGDLAANLVYDRNTKNKFLVYGSFDLARTGKLNPNDTEVVKRLITQWGGEVVPDINVDTDFVVLGAEPQVPTLSKDDLQDPVQKAIYDRAVAESEAYANISNKARDYKIPILNQNRFLYMIGYYELAKR
jgi:hypothetical protein